MSIKITGNRKVAIVLLLILFLVVGGSGGYLLWRTNQEKTVAPTESEAGGGGFGCYEDGTCDCDCYKEVCDCGCEGQVSCQFSGRDCDTPCCVWPYVAWFIANQGEGNCACAHRTKKHPEGKTNYECHDTTPKCTPDACPTGYIDMHIPRGGTLFEPSNYSPEDLALIEAAGLFNHNTKMLCSENPGAALCYTQCKARCKPCENTYCVRRICKKAPTPKCGDGILNQEWEECDPPGSTCPNNQTCENCKCKEPPPVVCDGAGKGWDDILNPNGKTYQTCTSFNYKYQIGSSQGVDTSSVDVRIGSTVITPTITPSADGKTATVEGTLNGSDNCLSAGTKELTIKWKAKGEATYSNTCMGSATFTIKEMPPAICDGLDRGTDIIFTNGRLVGGEYIYNDNQEVQYEYVMGDSVGINLQPGPHYPELLVGGTPIIGSPNHPQPTFTPNTGVHKQVKISGKLNTQGKRLSTGVKDMKISWKRVGETTPYSKDCQIPRSFIINTCDGVGAQWRNIPPTKIYVKEGEDPNVSFEYVTGDSDGVKNESITLLLDGEALRVDKEQGNGKTVKIWRTPLPASKLGIGKHTLEIIWQDIYDAGNDVLCSASTEFEIKEKQLPDWDMQKVAEEVCIDDGTEDPQSKITNTITVTNNGTADGGLKQIVDTLDPKVVGNTVKDISNGGIYADGKITWIFDPADVYTPGEPKRFTYSYIVSKDKFGIYDNTAVGTTVADNTFEGGASIEARCNVVSPSCGDGKVDTDLGEQCDPPGSACTDAYGNASICTNHCSCPGEAPVPKTGIFDESRNIVILGAILLFTGLGWTWIASSYRVLQKKATAQSKSRFERRVVK